MSENAPNQDSARWRAIDLFDFARTGRDAAGTLALSDLSRLAGEVPDNAPPPGASLEFHARGAAAWDGAASAQPGPWLHLTVRGRVWLLCQRCLAPCEQPVAIDQWYRIVATEEEADAAPIDDDEVEVVVGSASFDLLDLIDEEIMLSLPLVPRHAVCPEVHEALGSGESPAASDAGTSTAESQRPNPFAALAGLARERKTGKPD